jgi:serine/threonine protein kinase
MADSVASPSDAALASSAEEYLLIQSNAWQAKRFTLIEDLLPRELLMSLTQQKQHLLNLICNEIRLRTLAGQSSTLEEYQTRFPDLSSELSIQWQVNELLSTDKVNSTLPTGEITVDDVAGQNTSRTTKLPERIGRYPINAELGRGAVGVVYEAWDPKLKRRIAIKKLRYNEQTSASELQRFRAEAEAVALINHPNVIQVFDVDDDNGVPFIAMELCEGGSLSRRLQRGPLSVPDAAELISKIASGVSAAHKLRIVHRDLKPGNILMHDDKELFPKVNDFGLAKLLDQDVLGTQSGLILGSPAYMAPEQASGSGKNATMSMDVYAIGTILYECLTGRPPFQGANVPETLELVRKSDPVPIRRLEPHVPVDLETIVSKCLRKLPEQRYASVDDFAADIERFRQNRPIVARRRSVIEHAYSWCRRNPGLSTMAAACCVVIIGSLALLSWMNIKVRRESFAKTQALQQRTQALELRTQALAQSKSSEELANQRYYDSRIAAAHQSILRMEKARAEDLLIKLDPKLLELNGFEWQLLQAQLFSQLEWKTHTADMSLISMDISPDGSRVVVTAGDVNGGAYALYDVTKGHPIRTWPAGVTMNACGFHPNGKFFVAISGDGVIYKHDLETLEMEKIESKLFTKSMTWNQDGSKLFIGDEKGRLGVFDGITLEKLEDLQGEGGPILRVFTSDDSKRLYTSADWGTKGRHSTQWDLTTPTVVKLQEYDELSLSDESPDGRQLVGMDWGLLKMIDRETNEIIQKKSVSTGPLISATFTDEQLVLAVRNDRELRIVSLDSFDVINTFQVSDSLCSVALEPAMNLWATGDVSGDLRIWRTSDKQPCTYDYDANKFCRMASFISGSSDILLADSESSKVWTPRTGSTKEFHQANNVLTASSDGHVLAKARSQKTNEAIVEVWYDEDAEPTLISRPYAIYEQCLTLSDNGRWLATRGNGTDLDIFDLTASHENPAFSFNARCYSLCFSKSSELVACGEFGGSVRAFDLRSGKQLPPFAQFRSYWSWGMCTAFNDDQTLIASGTESGTIRVWEVATGKEIATLSGGQGEILSLDFFADHRRIVSGGAGEVRIWDYQAGQELISMSAQEPQVLHVEVNDAGDTVLALTKEGHLRVWAVE